MHRGKKGEKKEEGEKKEQLIFHSSTGTWGLEFSSILIVQELGNLKQETKETSWPNNFALTAS